MIHIPTTLPGLVRVTENIIGCGGITCLIREFLLASDLDLERL